MKSFKEILAIQKLPTLTNHKKLQEMYKHILLSYCDLKNWTCCEVGVYKGGTANFIANMMRHNISDATKKKLILIDTFEGIPYSKKGVDTHKIGDFKDANFERLLDFFEEYKLSGEIYKSEFWATKKYIENNVFDFIHLDVDVYDSYMQCLDFFYPKMKPRGVMLFDDYKAPGCPGAKDAIDQFVKQNSLEEKFTDLETEQGVICL